MVAAVPPAGSRSLTSHVLDLPPLSGRTFKVKWIPDEEDVTGLLNFDIYVSTNATDYIPWLVRATVYSAPFTGEIGRTFSFYSIARGTDGSEETPPPAGYDAQTMVSQDTPLLAPVPDQIAALDATLVLTNTVLGSAAGPFQFELGPDAPAGALVFSTNGVFRWRPVCRQGGSQQRITVWVTDTNAAPPLSDATTFTVTVPDCVEPGLGSAAVRAGTNGQLPLAVFSSAGITQLSFQVVYPAGLLSNFSLSLSNPPLCDASVQPIDASHFQVKLATCSGHGLQGTQRVAWLRFTTVAGQTSAFRRLEVTGTTATTAGGQPLAVALPGGAGRVGVVGEEPLLDVGRWTEREPVVAFFGAGGVNFRLEQSADLDQWHGLVTGLSDEVESYTDGGAPFVSTRFYRGVQLTSSNAVTGDHLVTTNGEVVIHPGNHAGFVMSWRGRMIYVDPVTNVFQRLPPADLILLTHAHTDHLNVTTINAVKGSNAVIIGPQVVKTALPANLQAITTVLTNGASTNWLGVLVEAVPMYNLSSSSHPKGVGNGYVLNLDGRRVYVSGDTDNTPDMRALTNIDVAFVCMRPPYTMDMTAAASAVRSFRPRVVYPYHYLGNDVNVFKQLVGTDLGIEVRLRPWY